jgi:uncharacterized LabA/DUF88 family protein
VSQGPRVPSGPGFFILEVMKKVVILIDGFNVYHALQQDERLHKYKWLDYYKLSKCYVTSKDQIVDVYYFTAFVHWNPRKVERHKIYLRALSMAGVKAVFGKFKDKDHKCRICGKEYSTFEEKQTDVNIAITLFRLAVSNDFEAAILISGDTDLVPAIEAIKKTFPNKQIGVVVPIGRRAKELVDVCDFHMKMKEKHLRTSQFPDTIYLDAQKRSFLQRPKSWV